MFITIINELTGNLLECVWRFWGAAGLDEAIGASKPAAPGILAEGSLYKGYGGILYGGGVRQLECCVCCCCCCVRGFGGGTGLYGP